MATPDIAPYNNYIGNGVTTEFSVAFPYIKKDFVKVYVRGDGESQEEMSPVTDWSTRLQTANIGSCTCFWNSAISSSI